MTRPAGLALSLTIVLAAPRPAWAGMPTVMLTDIARARFQTVSFFVLVLLLCAWAVKGLWNAVAVETKRVPRLSYGKACGVVALWGSLFVLVLTMISGRRELMTPGAWARQGLISRLADPPPPPSTEPRNEPIPARRAKLERLRTALWAYARAHDGRFPPDDAATPEIPDDAWTLPDPSGIRYLYVPGRKAGEFDVFDAVLAYEPGLFGSDRWVLTANGNVQVMPLDQIRKALDARKPGQGGR